MTYNAEDINGGQPEYYPAMPDFSLPFSMANIWKKKTCSEMTTCTFGF